MERIKVIIARPGENAVVEEIVPDYDVLEQIVGGELEFTDPFMEDVIIVCDRQGKQKGKPANRLLFGSLSIPFIKDGHNIDAYAGTIVIFRYRDEKAMLSSLTEEDIAIFTDIYGKPQFLTDWTI